jgi:hypothetical protein
MKRLLFALFTTFCLNTNAQCLVTITGNHSVCAGISDTLTASGATSYVWMPGNLSGSSVIVTPPATTIYTVTGTTGTCTATNTINVIVHPLPSVTFTTDINYPYFNIYPTYSSNVISASWYILTYSFPLYYYSPSPTSSTWHVLYSLYPQVNLSITNPDPAGIAGYATVYTVCVTVGDSFGCADTSNYYNNLPNCYCEAGWLCNGCDTSTAHHCL